MSEPIISPWLFYFIDVCGSIRALCLFSCVILFIGLLWQGMDYVVAFDYKKTEIAKKIKGYLIVLAAFSLVFIITPTPATVYKMIIASYVTPDNINTGIEITKDGIQFIMQTIVDTAKQLKEM